MAISFGKIDDYKSSVKKALGKVSSVHAVNVLNVKSKIHTIEAVYEIVFSRSWDLPSAGICMIPSLIGNEIPCESVSTITVIPGCDDIRTTMTVKVVFNR